MVPARHTSTLFISGFCLTTMRLSRRFRVGGLLSGRRTAAPPGRHRPGRGLLRLPRLHGAVEGRRSVAIVAGPCGAHKLAIHTPRFRCFSSVVRCSRQLWAVVFVRAYFVYEWCGVRFDCRECAFFLCVHRCELIGFAGRLQCTGSHFPSPEVRFLCRCAAFRVFCVRADCVQQSCIFLQRRALLPIIETQKSPC